MYCPKCGSEIEDYSKFCSACGERINTYKEKNKPNQTKPKLAVLGLILAAMFVLGISMIGAANSKKQISDGEIKRLVYEYANKYEWCSISEITKIEKTEDIYENQYYIVYAEIDKAQDSFYATTGTLAFILEYFNNTKKWQVTDNRLWDVYNHVTYNVEGKWGKIEISNQTDYGMDIYIDSDTFGQATPVHVEAVNCSYFGYNYKSPDEGRIIYVSESKVDGSPAVRVYFESFNGKSLKVRVEAYGYAYDDAIVKNW